LILATFTSVLRWDANKPLRVQLLLELRDGVIDAIRLAFRNIERHLLFGVEMRDPSQFEKAQPVSQPQGDAIWIIRVMLAKGVG
jgi:hypothetical protein